MALTQGGLSLKMRSGLWATGNPPARLGCELHVEPMHLPSAPVGQGGSRRPLHHLPPG